MTVPVCLTTYATSMEVCTHRIKIPSKFRQIVVPFLGADGQHRYSEALPARYTDDYWFQPTALYLKIRDCGLSEFLIKRMSDYKQDLAA